MKILCISDAWLPQINGVVRTYQNLGEALGKMGHDFKVIGPSSFKITIPAPSYPEIRLAIFAHWTLPALIEAEHPDAIHIATEGPLGRAAHSYCRRKKIPFTTCYHTQFPDYLAKRIAKGLPFLYNPVKRAAIWSLRKFHGAAVATMLATQSLEDELLVQGYRNNFHRFVRGINLTVFHPGEKKHLNDLKRPVALYVGRIAIEKNIEAFLDAPWHGSKAVVGDGPALEELKTKYPHVTFTGAKTGLELGEYYRSGDVFAFPSKTDTFGMVLIEALASGLPVAAHPVIGPIDIITAPQFGALDDDFGTALARAANAPGTPESRAHDITKIYTWEAAASQFLEAVLTARPASDS